MILDYIPVLSMQRDLQNLPRGRERFEKYLGLIANADRSEATLIPLIAANPMAREHVTECLDALLAIDADRVAAKCAIRVAGQFPSLDFRASASLVVVDDAGGGWTNRFAYELQFRRIAGPSAKRFWLSGPIWSSEIPTVEGLRDVMTAAAFRTAYVFVHGPAENVGELIEQEAFALGMAGTKSRTLDQGEWTSAREILSLIYAENDMRTAIQFLFGDAAGATLGFAPLGLSPNAGIDLARTEGARKLIDDRRIPSAILSGWEKDFGANFAPDQLH